MGFFRTDLVKEAPDANNARSTGSRSLECLVALRQSATCLALILGLVALGGAGCSTTHNSPHYGQLLKPLRPYVQQVAEHLDQVPEERRILLTQIATNMAARLDRGEHVNLTFICTHNSRRSHMSQIWAQTAAYYYGLDRVQAFSGGTEATACNCRTVTAMRKVGFTFKEISSGDNPIYLVWYASDRPPIRAYSKYYNADGNPKSNFLALMTCSQADLKCPVVEGAVGRYAIHYMDPKLCDDTPEETHAYDQRCREIAAEMFFIMAEVRKRFNGRNVTASTR